MATALTILGIDGATNRRLPRAWAAGTVRAGLMLGIGDSRFQDEGERGTRTPARRMSADELDQRK